MSEIKSGLAATPDDYVQRIRASRKSIYDPIEIGSQLWIPSQELERLLQNGLRGLNLENLPLRTRSKVVKTEVCKTLGYPVPTTFTKTQPRFLGQQFDTYIQKANNLQVWNEELSPTRRYVVIKVNQSFLVERVRVVSGDTLAKLDTTGTLTQKYQARLVTSEASCELISQEDTQVIRPHTCQKPIIQFAESPASPPLTGRLLPIGQIFERLCPLIGQQIADPGYDQERNRGAELHKRICSALGYAVFGEDGQFPDVRHQLLEVKLQTSPTIDLGLVLPSSTLPLDVSKLGESQVRHCDVRYAVFYGRLDGTRIQLTHFILTTGGDFFTRFQQFQGKVLNKKLQIPLPRTFFDVVETPMPLLGN
jgi:hypothetical protein